MAITFPKTIFRGWVLVTTFSILFGSSLTAADRMVFPRADWQEVRPEEQNVDSVRLNAAVSYLKDNSGRDKVRELVIIRNGYMIWKGDNIDKMHGIWSATKSFTSTVLGLLIDDGKATLDTKAGDYLPDMAATYPDITLRHFTTMTSGYYAVGDEPRGRYRHGPSKTPFKPGPKPLFTPPGSRYAYWDSAMNQFANVLTRIAGEEIENLFQKRIAGPIGMNRKQWRWGDFGKVDGIVVNGGAGNNSKHIFISAREMARFAHLFLNRGNWAGKQLISSAWVDAATKPQVSTSLLLQRQRSSEGRGVYGYNWWVNGIKPDGRRKWPGATFGTYSASGHNNNDIFIIPEWNMVIVRLGLDQKDVRISDNVWGTFLNKVGQAIKGTAGPLRVHPDNPRYFTDGSGRAVYLTGSHTWDTIVDMGRTDPPRKFNFPVYLNWIKRLNHNFIRLWTCEPATWDTSANKQKTLLTAAPQPWARTGPGKALDGKPKFNLDKFNPIYFDRLRNRVSAADKQGIYVSIMLFEGWAMQFSNGAWEGHPFNPKNNINGIDGDVNKDGKGLEIHTLENKAVTAVQETYVRKVIDTVNDLDNLLYEISNENHPPSTQWQYHIIRFIKNYEKTKPKQHPVGMTFQYKGGKNETLFNSPADWISPNHQGGYRDNPPPADGRKVVLSDTDHLGGIWGNQAWVWKSFIRGYNPIFMDTYKNMALNIRKGVDAEAIRRNMGYTLGYARRMNLTAMTPRNDLASTKYCLAHPGREYLIYNPAADKPSFTVRLKAGSHDYEWFNPGSGKVVQKGSIKSTGGKQKFKVPFKGDAVLYLKAKDM